MRSLLLVLSVLLAAGSTFANGVFPETWFGRWHGQLAGAPLGTAMTLQIGPAIAVPSGSPRRWHWLIQYTGEAVRAYELVEVDPAAGIYNIDEKNGIFIELRAEPRGLSTMFSVQQKFILQRWVPTPTGIWYESETYPTTPSRRSSSGETTVCAFRLLNRQTSLLVRQP